MRNCMINRYKCNVLIIISGFFSVNMFFSKNSIDRFSTLVSFLGAIYKQ